MKRTDLTRTCCYLIRIFLPRLASVVYLVALLLVVFIALENYYSASENTKEYTNMFINIKSKGKRRKRCKCSFSGKNSVVLSANFPVSHRRDM